MNLTRKASELCLKYDFLIILDYKNSYLDLLLPFIDPFCDYPSS